VAAVPARRTAGASNLSWFDRAGKVLQSLGEPAVYTEPSISPDGKRIAVGVVDPETNKHQILLVPAAGGPSTRFTFGSVSSGYPIWSPDGNEILFSSNRRITGELYSKSPAGTRTEELRLASDNDAYPLDFSRDGRYLALGLLTGPTGRNELWVQPLYGDRKPAVFLDTGLKDCIARFSPDGRWLAYSSYESGLSEIYVTGFPGGKGKWQISRAGGFEPRWSRDGRTLFFVALDGTLTEVPVRNGATLQTGTPRALFRIPPGAQTSQWSYDVSLDGNRFLIVVPALSTDPSTSITLVTNWASDLKR
jgi:eukaryotic-like serine/threonine-protein kinase